MSNGKAHIAYALKKQDGEKLVLVGNAIENPSARFQPAFTLINGDGNSIPMVIDPTKDGNLILKKLVPTGEKDENGKDKVTYEGVCVLFKSLTKNGGKVYYRGKSKETGEVFRMFSNDRAA